MRAIGKYVKAPEERKRYQIDYDGWLDVGETLSGVTFGVIPATGLPIAVDGVAIAAGARSVAFYVSAGDDGVTYTVLATATTSGGQIKEDQVHFIVRDPGAL
jgi:hypothetical protein